MTTELATTDTDMAIPRRYGLMPQSMQEAMQLANIMATARLVPKDLQKSPGDCLMVIQQAIRWDMDPFAVAQECSVIQGKLMHTGKLVAAVVNARGNLVRRLSYDYRGEGDNRTITVSGQLQGEDEPRTVEVMLRNARTPNTQWTKQPDQQLMYHGVRVWARRHTPELMLGVYSAEEFEEAPRRALHTYPPLPPHDAETGEVIDTSPQGAEYVYGAAHQGVPNGEESPTLQEEAQMAAQRGTEAFRSLWRRLSQEERGVLWPESEKYKRIAADADALNAGANANVQ